MSNVKPGNLAMVVDAPEPWGGATCTVIRPAVEPGADERIFGSPGPFWWVKLARPMRCLSNVHGVVTSSDCVLPDAHLRKIGGLDVDVEAVQFNPLAHEQTA